MEKKLPFAAHKESRNFFHEMMQLIIREFDRNKHVPNQNVQIFYHGRGWVYQREEAQGFSTQTGNLELVSTPCSIEIDRVIQNDLSLVPEFIEKMAGLMSEGMMERMVQMMQEVTAETGNTVTLPKEGSAAPMFIDMLKSIQLSVADDGTVPRPSLFIHPDNAERLQAAAAMTTPEQKEQIETLWKQKEAEAREREALRLSKYSKVQ